MKGNLFATGPGGVLVIAPDGTHLGTIETGGQTANFGWGDDGSMLYITADKTLYRMNGNERKASVRADAVSSRASLPPRAESGRRSFSDYPAAGTDDFR